MECMILMAIFGAVILSLLYSKSARKRTAAGLVAPPNHTMPAPGSSVRGHQIPTPHPNHKPAQPVQKPTPPRPPEFVISDTALNVMNWVIPRPMFYITPNGGGRYYGASVIDLARPIASNVSGYVPELNYWPQYHDLSPQQRCKYFEWLAGDRSDPNSELGYVFIFFYGLERRLLEGHNRAEIRDEIKRLASIYTESRSFQRYASQLLIFDALRNIQTYKEEELDEVFPLYTRHGKIIEDALYAQLAWYTRADKPISWNLALAIARHDPRSPNSVIFERAKTELETLYARRFEERFPNGFRPKPAARNHKIYYQPASPSLIYEPIGLAPILLENPLGRSAQFKTIIQILIDCLDALKGYSRAVARSIEDELTAELWEKLPPDLKAETPHPDTEQWLNVISEHLDQDGWAHIPAGMLAMLRGIDKRPRLTRVQASGIAETLEAFQLSIEPDPRLTLKPWSWDEIVIVYRDEELNTHLQPESQYAAASLILNLAMMIAAADGDIVEDEIEITLKFIHERFRLSQPEQKRLEALTRALSHAEINLQGMAKRLEETLSEKQRTALGKLLIEVALADGTLDASEKKGMKRAFKVLGLDGEQALQQAEETLTQRTRAMAEPVTVRQGSTIDEGEPIPPRPQSSTAAQEDTSIALDPMAIAKILQETREIAHVLNAALADATPEPDEPIVLAPTSTPQNTLSSGPLQYLESRYQPFLAELTTQKQWSVADFDALSRKHNVMPAGAIDVINDWADEHLGDFLLEGDGPYTVSSELLEEA